MKKKNIATEVFVGLILGIICGLLINEFFMDSVIIENIFVNGIFKIIGQIFIKAIMMLVVPLVFVSIALGVAQMGDVKTLGRIGTKTLIFYMMTTVFAIILGIIMASLINPGVNFDVSTINQYSEYTNKIPDTEQLSFVDNLINIVPSNMFEAFTTGNMLQVIFISIFFGIAMTALADKVKKISELFEEVNKILIKMLMMLMRFAPIAVFSMILKTFAEVGISMLIPLLGYVGTVLFAMILQVLVVYMLILWIKNKINPLMFIKNMIPAISFAFSTSSSSGTLPITKECVEENCGVNKEISSFILPIGATINMDGTAIMQGVAVIFLANIYGIDLNAMDFLTVVVIATVSSIGTAGVPSSGTIMLSMVITQIGLPIESLVLILSVDRIVDMARTVVNILGDAVCSMVISKSENKFDQEIYYAKPKL